MDPLANMLVQIRNAGLVGHESVTAPYSKIKESVAKVLEKEGYLKSVEVKTVKGKKSLVLGLLIENRIPRIQGAKRISKPSKRIYKKSADIRKVKNGYGLLVMSTPQGVMSGYDARKASLGGEALFIIW